MESGQRETKLKIFARATRQQRLFAGIVLLSIAGCFAACWIIARYDIPIYPFGCGFRQRYGLPCPTCGMTTSVLAFAQARLIDSFYAQPAASFFCSLAGVTAFFAFLVSVFGIYSPFLARRLAALRFKYVIIVLALILAAGWVITLARALAASR